MSIESIIKRYDILASKIICNSYASKFGKYDTNTKKYELGDIQKEKIIDFNYFNPLNNKYYNIQMDGDFRVRNNLNNEIDSIPGSFYKLEDLIDNTTYVKGQKTHLLKNICLSLFDDDSISMDYTPKEVMNFIEKMSNGKITFTATNDSSLTYINPGTFRSVFYQAKKERKMDFSNYDNLINISNDLISQKGIKDSEKENLEYELLNTENFKSLFIKPNEASKYDEFKSLKKYETLKHVDLEDNIKDIIPSRTFKRIINNSKDNEYKILFQKNEKNKDLLQRMVIENPKNLIFDPFNILKYQFSTSIMSMTYSIGETIQKLLGSTDYGATMSINGAILEELVNASNPHSPLTIKNLKNIIEDDELSENYASKFNDIIQSLAKN